MMTFDEGLLDRLRELAEAGKAGGWQEVATALDMGDIVIAIRERGSRGDQKAAAKAAGMSVATLWRRAKLAEHRDLIERERPANLTEAFRLVKRTEAEEKAEGGGEAGEKPTRGRRKRDPLEVLKDRLCSAVATIAQQRLLREVDVVLAVRGAYRAGLKVRAEYEAAMRDQEATEADAAEPKPSADVIPLARRERPKLAVVEGGLDEALRRAVRDEQEAAARGPEPVDPPPGVPGEWSRIDPAAKSLGIAPKTVRDRIKRGKIPWRYRGDGRREVWVAERKDTGGAGEVA
jgi:hypothetical protein